MFTNLLGAFALILFAILSFVIYKSVSKSQIKYGTIDVDGQTLSVEQTRNQPVVSIAISSPYSVVLFDKDAPASAAKGLSYLHWAISNGQTLVPYQGPQPPSGSGTHRYQFNIYRGSLNSIDTERSEFDVNKIPLQEYDSLYFTVDSN